jgi:hypothetical protein
MTVGSASAVFGRQDRAEQQQTADGWSLASSVRTSAMSILLRITGRRLADRGKAADKMHVGLSQGQGGITPEECLVVRPRYRLIRIAFGFRIFPDHRSSPMRLPGQMFEFRDAGIGMIVRIVDRSDALMAYDIRQMLMFEAEIAVRQVAVTIIEIRVDWAREKNRSRVLSRCLDDRACARTFSCNQAMETVRALVPLRVLLGGSFWLFGRV